MTASSDISPPHWQESDGEKYWRVAARLTYGPKSLSHTELFQLITETLPAWRRALDGKIVQPDDRPRP